MKFVFGVVGGFLIREMNVQNTLCNVEMETTTTARRMKDGYQYTDEYETNMKTKTCMKMRTMMMTTTGRERRRNNQLEDEEEEDIREK